jgi:predicted MPP superfamily phosphohydrolase
LIPQSIEELYIRDPGLKKKQKELEETVVERTKKEIMQFKDDKQQYVRKEDNRIQILHISDIHLKNKSQANKYFNQLVIDLKMLEVNRLGYIIISGDIANQATREEYEAAYDMLNSLVNHFGLNLDRVVLVPGNHDLNWD